MKRNAKVLPWLIIGLTISLNLKAESRVIYGEDNRLDLNEHPLQTFRQMGASVAVQVDNNKIVVKNESAGLYGVLGQSLVSYGICPQERFSHQITAVRCSGFMAAKDIIVTSGQCIQNQDDCKNYSWIFDYKLNATSDSSVRFTNDQRYTCKSIVARVYDPTTKEDYAVIRMDREIVGRQALKFRKEGAIAADTKLFNIGSSLGLPLKIADGGLLLSDKSEKFFVTNLDSAGGGVGSPIINETSLEVEGIYIGGEKDYVFNPELNCSESKRCLPDGSDCKGERATRITVLSNLNFWRKMR